LERRRGQSFRADGDTWQTNSDARKEHRVCENCDTKKINEHGRVPEPRKCDLRIAPCRRLGFRKGRGDWPPAFNCPFTEQMTQPAAHPGPAWNRVLRCVHRWNVTQPSWLPEGQQAGSLQHQSGEMFELARYDWLNNPLTAFHNVRAGLGGPARATSTG